MQGASADGGGARGSAVGPTRLVISEEKTAEMLFPAGKKKSEDYHENMDCNVFMRWLEKRLWSTFKAMYGEDKKIILILDNAAYHHGMEEGWKSPLKMSKKEDAALLRDLGIAEINIARKGESMKFEISCKDGAFANKSKGPTMEEVQEATFKAVKEKRSEDLLTRAERWFKENDAGYMLFTPPYCPDFQPIELFWGVATNYVGRTCGGASTMKDAVTSLRRGWYGGEAIGEEGAKQPVDCKALIGHSIRCVNEAIKRDETTY